MGDIAPALYNGRNAGVWSGGQNFAIFAESYGTVIESGDDRNLRPVFDIALAKVVLSNGFYGAVCAESHSVELTDGDGSDAGPVLDIALAFAVVTNGSDGAVGAEKSSVPEALADLDVGPVCRSFPEQPLYLRIHTQEGAVGGHGGSEMLTCPDVGDTAPALYNGLNVGVWSGGHDFAILTKSYGTVVSGSNGADPGPALDVALTVVVLSNGFYGAVGAESHRMEFAGGDGTDAGPVLDIALALVVVTNGSDGAVGAEKSSVPEALADLDIRLFFRNCRCCYDVR